MSAYGMATAVLMSTKKTYLKRFAIFKSSLTTHLSIFFHMRTMSTVVSRFINMNTTLRTAMEPKKRTAGRLSKFFCLLEIDFSVICSVQCTWKII